jgi:hypothetical protein
LIGQRGGRAAGEHEGGLTGCFLSHRIGPVEGAAAGAGDDQIDRIAAGASSQCH